MCWSTFRFDHLNSNRINFFVLNHHQFRHNDDFRCSTVSWRGLSCLACSEQECMSHHVVFTARKVWCTDFDWFHWKLFIPSSETVSCIDQFVFSSFLCVENRYMDGLLSEYDYLLTKFKPLVPKQPRPQLLVRHVSENLRSGPNHEQVKQLVFDWMKALIQKEVLSVQVLLRHSVFYSSFSFMLHYRTLLSYTGMSQWVQKTQGLVSSETIVSLSEKPVRRAATSQFFFPPAKWLQLFNFL